MDFARLEVIAQLPPEEHLKTLLEEVEYLQEYIKSGHIQPDFLTLLYELLSSITSSTETSVAHLLLALSTAGFHNVTKEFILNLPLVDDAKKEQNKRFWSDPNRFFLNVSTTLKMIINELTTTALDTLPSLVKGVLYTLPNIEKQHGVLFDDAIKLVYEDVRSKLDAIVEQYQVEKETERGRSQKPPDDFRDIDVYPSAWEINSKYCRFLRKNLIKGPYDNLDHYLDVQFRLIREDFIAPLRNDLCAFLEGAPQSALNIKIHKDVRVIGIKLHNRQTGFLVQVFKPNIRCANMSERFMYGSLVCLTQDNFKTIRFARIIDSSQSGCILLSLASEELLHLNAVYTLVECAVYFEPYFHVMNVLKSITWLPMQEYFVHVSQYIEDDNVFTHNDSLSDDCDSEPEFELDKSTFSEHILRRKYLNTLRKDNDKQRVALDAVSEKPVSEKCLNTYGKLNDSQRVAYDAAMSKEFCLIQGPPGTGKTFLSLHIARELLRRRVCNSGPILVVCFTNHALDQFLEGLLDTTDKMIRIGGQSKSEALERFNFNNIRTYRYLKAHYTDEYKELDAELKRLAVLISMLCQYNYIINFNYFERIDPNYRNSWFAGVSNRDMLEWLLFQQEPKMKGVSWRRQSDNVYIRPKDIEGYFHFVLCDMAHDLFTSIRNLRGMEFEGLMDTLHYVKEEEKYRKLQLDYDYAREQLDMLRELKTIPKLSEINVNYKDPSQMAPKDRWLLYGSWVNAYKRYFFLQYRMQISEMNSLKKEIDISADSWNAETLSFAEVVGMTTTSAARLHNVLRQVSCPIVIVEEAAEVLESHIIASLTPACRKLILVGDHKQLKPSTADFQTTIKYNLGVSLFERMVNNGVPCFTLTEQRRMRPEIASLISPSIYATLTNAVEVQDYPTVRGMSKSLFFITHQHREEVSNTSRKNVFEAQYLMLLARHLVLNGYDPKKVTMIAAYSGQSLEMQRIKKGYDALNEMRISVLDNFQGEENDIILLSLVRNNAEGINGFLNLENRVCVALSRARHGLYIMGNMEQLCKGNNIWPKIAEVLKNNDALGEYLTSHCVNHPITATQLCAIEDFDKMPKGGCKVACKMLLQCGHICKDVCHAYNHDEYICSEPCTKVLCETGHVCPKRCFMNCGECFVPRHCELPCGHSGDVPCHLTSETYLCQVKLRVELKCGHENEKKCHVDTDDVQCSHPCDEPALLCGHTCLQSCHKFDDPNHETLECNEDCKKYNLNCNALEGEKHRCQKKCSEECESCEVAVQRERNCCHIHLVMCHENVNTLPCKIRCKKELPCGHICTKWCSQTCEPCLTEVLKERPDCHHKELVSCGRPIWLACAKPCEKLLPCGHKCDQKCYQLCKQSNCIVEVEKKINECGHKQVLPCMREPLRKYCNSQCDNQLPCGHQCLSLCAQPCKPEECMTLVPVNIELSCEHQGLNVPCKLKNCTKANNELLRFCTEVCVEELRCGHKCAGSCGKCAQSRFHKGCMIFCKETRLLPLDSREPIHRNFIRNYTQKTFYSKNCMRYNGKIISLYFLKKLWIRVEEMFTNNEFLGRESNLHAWCSIVENILQICSAYEKQKVTELDEEVQEYLKFIRRKCASNLIIYDQHFIDFKIELNRLKRIVELDCLRTKFSNIKRESSYNICREMLFKYSKYDQAQDTDIKGHLETLCKIFDADANLYVSQAEWVE